MRCNIIRDPLSGGIATGSYVGNGTNPRTIDLGFKAKALLVWPTDGKVTEGSRIYGALAIDGLPAILNEVNYLEITNSGFTIREASVSYAMALLNNSARSYYFVAFK